MQETINIRTEDEYRERFRTQRNPGIRVSRVEESALCFDGDFRKISKLFWKILDCSCLINTFLSPNEKEDWIVCSLLKNLKEHFTIGALQCGTVALSMTSSTHPCWTSFFPQEPSTRHNTETQDQETSGGTEEASQDMCYASCVVFSDAH